jgi:hypothetical protein
MKERKLEYFLRMMPQSDIDAFSDRLDSSSRKRFRILGFLLTLILSGMRDNEQIYARIYPKKCYTEKQMRNLRSALFAKLTDFLCEKELNLSLKKELLLPQAMNRLGTTRYFPSVMQKLESGGKQACKSVRQLEYLADLKFESLKYQNSFGGNKSYDLPEVIDRYEEAFAARTLYFALANHSYRNRMKASGPNHSTLLPAVLRQIEQGAFAGSLMVQIYYSLFQLQKYPENPVFFEQVKSTLSHSGQLFAKADVKEIYRLALNHCASAVNRGMSIYLKEYFHLCAEMLDRDLFVEDGRISPWQFKSLVTIAIRLGHFQWTRDFMRDYAALMTDRYSRNCLNYCHGLLAFYRADFTRAEALMNDVLQGIDDPFLGIDARSYLLRIYYETDDESGMDAMCTSFRLFLRRHRKIDEKRLKNHLEFIRFFRRLVSLGPDDEHRAGVLYDEIVSTPYHASRDWLMEKLALFLPKEISDPPAGKSENL